MEEIEDVLDDSGPLLYMGSVLSESCEELEILMEYLSLEDDDGQMVTVDILWQYAFDSLTVKI